MQKIYISLLIGCFAGLLDIIPMLIQKLDWHATLSAFIQWLVLGLLIAHIEFKLPAWLKGLLVAELCALPIVVLVAQNDLVSVLPILIMSALLGSLTGYLTARFAR